MRLLIVGGGPAGIFAAITAAREYPKLEVVVLERDPTPLRKLEGKRQRVSVTRVLPEHAEFAHGYVRGHEAMTGWLPAWGPQDVVAWLAKIGVNVSVTPDARAMVVGKTGGELRERLLREAEDAGVRILSEAAVTDATATSEGFRVWLKSGPPHEGDFLLLATGSHTNGTGYLLGRQFGHNPVNGLGLPVLLTTRDARLRRLGEVHVPGAAARLPEFNLSARGGVSLLQQGIGGDAVLELTSRVGRDLAEKDFVCLLEVNWAPELGNSQPTRQLRAIQEAHQKRAVVEDPPFGLPLKLWQRLALVGAKLTPEMRWGALSQAQLQALAGQIVTSRFKIDGRATHRAEWASSGGIPPSELIAESLESRFRKGLYFAGELVDVSGIPGGYNLQAAWTTGRIAGLAIAAAAKKKGDPV